MIVDAWLPNGHMLPDGAKSRLALFEGIGWQIIETHGGGKTLLAHDDLTQRWINSGLLEHDSLADFDFGNQRIWSISCCSSQALEPISSSKSPNTKSEALAFVRAFKATRDIESELSLQDAIYVECISRLLPTYNINSRDEDEFVLGYWLTGGARISVKSFRRLCQTISWLNATALKEIIEDSGFEVSEVVPFDLHEVSVSTPEITYQNSAREHQENSKRYEARQQFELPGRPDLESFINEHIIDIIQNRERYKLFGIGFPSAIVLHGPPGCGKTYAVENLIDYLGWPSFQIGASSVASSYIHETSKKIADVFDQAIQNAPSILVIDEMEAFLADRDMMDGHHRLEEVAEFLKCIPEATKNEVLIVAMTNRIDMIDPAILRRGRFDHIIKVDYASEAEVLSLLKKLLSSLPKNKDVDLIPISKKLAGRPLSDVAFVVREGARLTARSGKDQLNQASLLTALHSSPMREKNGGTQTLIEVTRGEMY